MQSCRSGLTHELHWKMKDRNSFTRIGWNLCSLSKSHLAYIMMATILISFLSMSDSERSPRRALLCKLADVELPLNLSLLLTIAINNVVA